MTDVSTMIGEVAIDKPLRVSSSAQLREVAGIMEDAGVTCVLIGEGSTHLVTDHDLAGALAAGLGANTPIEQVATKTPVWATTSSTLAEAITMMLNHKIRHLLVLAPTGAVHGVLSLSTATRVLLDASAPLGSATIK
jgi:signal-transduction protein with cAMP-binding, CBS, and nucleotidyltransferase domain